MLDFKLVLKDDTLKSPELDAWLQNVEDKIRVEMKRVEMDLMVYGTATLSDGKTVTLKEKEASCD